MIRMQPSVENTQTIADSDAVAVERTMAGDRDAFRVLVERHSHNVFRLAYRMTRNRPDAEEVVQEAFFARGTEIAPGSAAFCRERNASESDGNGIMKHMTEEELIAYQEGVAAQRAVIAQHLAACEECRAELERIEAVLAALDTLPVPNPGDDYGRHVWQQIASRLPERPARWWQAWFEQQRLAALAAVAALLVVAFIAGRSMRD